MRQEGICLRPQRAVYDMPTGRLLGVGGQVAERFQSARGSRLSERVSSLCCINLGIGAG